MKNAHTKKTKNYDNGNYKLEKKMKTVAGRRDIRIELKYEDQRILYSYHG